ncbi:MAG: hypothetical protein HOP21_07895 [Methylotenera sp.]|nr:hypothetical protein [Methylotenera sp.]
MSITLNTSRLSLLWLRILTQLSCKRSNACLYGLSAQIHQWNIARVSNCHLHGLAQTFSIEHAQALKTIIHASISKTDIKQPEVVIDQLLFLVIGAIQIESQNDSNDAWQLVNRAVQNIATPKNEKPVLILFSIIMLLATFTHFSINVHRHSQPSITPTLPLVLSVNNSPDPVTISMLELTYHKMKAGTCQMPQAAMLAPEQRNAFLMFVNTGTIDVHHVKDLRLALGYVNCLYPQQLMHPSPA